MKLKKPTNCIEMRLSVCARGKGGGRVWVWGGIVYGKYELSFSYYHYSTAGTCKLLLFRFCKLYSVEIVVILSLDKFFEQWENILIFSFRKCM